MLPAGNPLLSSVMVTIGGLTVCWSQNYMHEIGVNNLLFPHFADEETRPRGAKYLVREHMARKCRSELQGEGERVITFLGSTQPGRPYHSLRKAGVLSAATHSSLGSVQASHTGLLCPSTTPHPVHESRDCVCFLCCSPQSRMLLGTTDVQKIFVK